MPEKLEQLFKYCSTLPKSACMSGRCPLRYNPEASIPIAPVADLERNIDGTVCPFAYTIADYLD